MTKGRAETGRWLGAWFLSTAILGGVAWAQEKAPAAAAEQPAEEERRERRRTRRERSRDSAILELDGATVEIVYSLLPVDGPDHASIGTLEAGEVLRLTRGMALKLKTGLELRFGELVARTENVAEDYPGVYSLWLRREAEGWSLVLNEEPDIWGTMRDPAHDVGSVPIRYWLDEEPARRLEVELLPVEAGGHLGIAWGRHRWGVDFTTGPVMNGGA